MMLRCCGDVESSEPERRQLGGANGSKRMPLFGMGIIKNISIVVITAIFTYTLKIRNISTEEIHPATTPGGFIKRQKTASLDSLQHGSSSLVSDYETYAPTYMPTVRVTMNQDEYHNMTQYINSTIDSNGVVIFAKSYCKHSKAAKELIRGIMTNMQQLLLPPELIIDVDLVENGSSIQEGLTRMTGQTTVPYVYVKKIFLGGNVDVQELAENGELQQLISSITISSHADENAEEGGGGRGRGRILRRRPKHAVVE